MSGVVAVDGRAGSWAVTTWSRRHGRSSRTSRRACRGRRGFEDVVKVTVFLTDIDDRPKINPVRQEVFGPARPASTRVEVVRLAVEGAKIEVKQSRTPERS